MRINPSHALSLGLLLAVGLRAAHPVVVLRGTLQERGVSQLEYLGDETALPALTLGGVSGAQLLDSRGESLRRQAELYAAAQRAAGIPEAELRPLHVLMDPNGDWAYATSGATVSYQGPAGPVQLRTPMLMLGEQMDYRKGAGAGTPEAEAHNRRLASRVATWWKQQLGESADLERDVLERMTLSRESGQKFDLVEAADQLSPERYLHWVSQASRQVLSQRGKDGDALWAGLEAEPDFAELVEQGPRLAALDGLARSVSHEIGHVIQFTAQGPGAIDLGTGAPHMNGGSHTLQTLSTPEFAFTEGWAEAHALYFYGWPPGQDPEGFRNIDYGTSADFVRRKLNQQLAQAVANRVTSAASYQGEGPFRVPAYDQPREDFERQLGALAEEQGLAAGRWPGLRDELMARPDLAHLERVDGYLQQLQALEGQPRSRYDFLRSEHAVAGTLKGLRERLGPEGSQLVLETWAEARPASLAALLEEVASRRPDWRVRLYQALAEVTGGILITPAQAAWVEAQGGDAQVDLDRDGRLPAGPARALDPDLFPEEPPPFPGAADPLAAPPAGPSVPVARVEPAPPPPLTLTDTRGGPASVIEEQPGYGDLFGPR